MTPVVKKALLFGTLLLGVLAVFGYEKVQKLKSIFDKMTLIPTDIRKIDWNWTRGLIFTMDVKLSNPTIEDFYAYSLGMVDLNRIVINYKGKYLATADVKGLNEVSVPAKGSMIIHDIDVVIPASNILSHALTFDTANLTAAGFMNDITISGVVTAFGTEYIIEN